MIVAWKIYGHGGSRQRASFSPSFHTITDNEDDMWLLNSDVTGTNDYSILVLFSIRTTADYAQSFLLGQLFDGAFEFCRIGEIEEIDVTDALTDIIRAKGGQV